MINTISDSAMVPTRSELTSGETNPQESTVEGDPECSEEAAKREGVPSVPEKRKKKN